MLLEALRPPIRLSRAPAPEMRSMHSLNRLVPVFTLAVLLMSAEAATAAPVFTCAAVQVPGEDDPCNGATYSLELTGLDDLGGGNYLYTIVFGVDTTGYDFNSTDYIRAVSFKSVVDNMSNMTLIGEPGPVGSWNVWESGLSGGGCKDPNGEEAGCAEAKSTLNGGFGIPVDPAGAATGAQYFWTFTFNSTDGSPAATGHIKYQYVTNTLNKKGEFDKIGSLGSFDTPLITRVPEPTSAMLLGLGIAAVFGGKSRFRQARRQ